MYICTYIGQKYILIYSCKIYSCKRRNRGIKLLIMRVARLILGNDFVFDRNQNARPRRVASRRRLVG